MALEKAYPNKNFMLWKNQQRRKKRRNTAGYRVGNLLLKDRTGNILLKDGQHVIKLKG